MQRISQQPEQIQYQEFSYNIPANGRIVVEMPFNAFHLISLTYPALKICFGDNSTETDFNNVGMGVRSDEICRRLILINTVSFIINVRISLGIGKIIDSRIPTQMFVYGGTVTTYEADPTKCQSRIVSVDSSVTLLTESQGHPTIIAAGDDTLYIGNYEDVYAGLGFPIYKGEKIQFNSALPLYGVRSGAAYNAYVLSLQA